MDVSPLTGVRPRGRLRRRADFLVVQDRGGGSRARFYLLLARRQPSRCLASRSPARHHREPQGRQRGRAKPGQAMGARELSSAAVAGPAGTDLVVIARPSAPGSGLRATAPSWRPAAAPGARLTAQRLARPGRELSIVQVGAVVPGHDRRLSLPDPRLPRGDLAAAGPAAATCPAARTTPRRPSSASGVLRGGLLAALAHPALPPVRPAVAWIRCRPDGPRGRAPPGSGWNGQVHGQAHAAGGRHLHGHPGRLVEALPARAASAAPQARGSPRRPRPPATPGSAPAPGTAGPGDGAPARRRPRRPTPAARGPEERVELESPGARFVLSTWGGTLRQVNLKEERFLQDTKNPDSGLGIVGTTTPERRPCAPPSPRRLQPRRWTAPDGDAPGADSVVFRAENDQVAVEKRYRLEGRYRLEPGGDGREPRQRRSPRAWPCTSTAAGPGEDGRRLLGLAAANLATLVCFVNERRHRAQPHRERWSRSPRSTSGLVRWLAADDKYFAVAAVPAPGDAPAGSSRKCVQRALDHLTGEVTLSFAQRTHRRGRQDQLPASRCSPGRSTSRSWRR